MPSNLKPGRPKGTGANVVLLKSLSVGDRLIIPAPKPDESTILTMVRNRFYNPAKRLGIKITLEVQGQDVIIKRVR